MLVEDPHILVNGQPLKKHVEAQEAEQRRTESEELRTSTIKEQTYHRPTMSNGSPLRRSQLDLLPAKEYREQVQRIKIVLQKHPKGLTYEEIKKRSGTVLGVRAIGHICDTLGAFKWKQQKWQGKGVVSFAKPKDYKPYVGKNSKAAKVGLGLAKSLVATPFPFPLPPRVPATAQDVEGVVKKVFEAFADAQISFWTTFKEKLK